MKTITELTPARLLEALQDEDTDLDMNPWLTTQVGFTLGDKDYVAEFDDNGDYQNTFGFDGGTKRPLSQSEEVKVAKTITAILLRFEGQ